MSEGIFGRDFDQEIVEQRLNREARLRALENTPERVSRMIEEAEEKARSEAFEEGRKVGRKEAVSETDEATRRLVSDVSPLLRDLLEGRSDHRAAVETDMSSFILNVMEKAVPEIISGYNEERIEKEVRTICKRAMGSRRLEVRTSPAMRQHVENLLTSCLGAADEARGLKVVGDGRLSDSEINASWGGGASEWSHERLCRDIIDILRADIDARKKSEAGDAE